MAQPFLEISHLRNRYWNRIRFARFGYQKDGFNAKRKTGCFYVTATALISAFGGPFEFRFLLGV